MRFFKCVFLSFFSTFSIFYQLNFFSFFYYFGCSLKNHHIVSFYSVFFVVSKNKDKLKNEKKNKVENLASIIFLSYFCLFFYIEKCYKYFIFFMKKVCKIRNLIIFLNIITYIFCRFFTCNFYFFFFGKEFENPIRTLFINQSIILPYLNINDSENSYLSTIRMEK